MVWVGVGKGRAGRAGRAEARQTKVWITDMEERWGIRIGVDDYLFSDQN